MLDIFSKRLQYLMELEGISRRSLSIAINVDRASIRLWLGGRFYPRYDALIKLATFFNVSVDGLLGVDVLQECDKRCEPLASNFKERAQQYFFIRLSAYMQEKHLTKYAIAKRLHIDQKSVSNWFIKGSVPETATIIRIAKMINVSIEELFGLRIQEDG